MIDAAAGEALPRLDRRVFFVAGVVFVLLMSLSMRYSFDRDEFYFFDALAVSTVIALPIVLPVLPASSVRATYNLNQTAGESIGWPQLIASARNVWSSLPAATRHRAVILTSNYGEAGAINELGRGSGLPIAVSGHNNEWWRGPGNPTAKTILAVAPGPLDTTGYAGYLHTFCRHVRTVATLRNPYRIHNQEWDGHIYICTGLSEVTSPFTLISKTTAAEH